MVQGKARPQQIVRLAQTDLDANKPVKHALQGIKGVGQRFSLVIIRTLGIDPDQKLSEIPAEKIKALEKAIESPKETGIPTWMLNRRKDPVAGSDLHLVGAKLDFTRMEDINLMKKIKSYKGVRHEAGLPVRGQKTRTSFRGKVSVGVVRKKVAGAAPAKPAAAPTAGKPSAAPAKSATPAPAKKEEKK